MVAGADTVASALSSLFACLLSRPDALARLEAEVLQLYPPGEDPMADPGKHREMRWLEACM